MKLFKLFGLLLFGLFPFGAAFSQTHPPVIMVGEAEVSFDPQGGMSYKYESKEVKGEIAWFAPGWSPRSQRKTSNGVFVAKGDTAWTWTQAYTHGKAVGTLTQSVEKTETGLRISYVFLAEEDFAFEGGFKGPFVSLNLMQDDAEGLEVSVGGKTVVLPVSNKWSQGNKVEIPAWDFSLKSKPGSSMSIWKSNATGNTEIRIKLGKPTVEGALTRYELSVELGELEEAPLPVVEELSDPVEVVVELEGAYGKVTVDANGVLRFDNGTSLSMAWFLNSWMFRSQERAAENLVWTHPSEKVWQWQATYVEQGKEMTLNQTLTDLGDQLELSYIMESPEDFPFQPASREPFLNLTLPAEAFKGKNILMGAQTLTLPANNVWSTGGKLVLTPQKLEFSFEKGATMSIWNQGKIPSIRAKSKTETGEKGKTYQLKLKMGKQTSEVSTKPIEGALMKKIRNYPRVLSLATTKGISTQVPQNWLKEAGELMNEKDSKAAGRLVGQAENWMDANARLIDLSVLLTQLDLFVEVVGMPENPERWKSYAVAAEALSAGEIEKALAVITTLREQLERIEKNVVATYGQSYLPATDYNPNSWVKAFRTIGYRPVEDELTPEAPRPMQVAWAPGESFDEGLTFSLVPEDAEDSADYQLESSWVRSTWTHNSGREYTFTVLTPMMHIDHVTEFPLSGIPGGIDTVSWRDENGQWVSATEDIMATMENQPAVSNGFWVKGKVFSALAFVTEKPEKIVRSKNGVEFTFARAASVSLLPMPVMATADEVKSASDFWGGVAVRSPADAVDLLNGNKVTHRMLYQDRPDAWETPANEIIPIPVLTVMSKKNSDWNTRPLWTQAGDFTYVDGDRLSVELPPRRIEQLRGINEYLNRLTDERIQNITDMSVDWVRVVIGPTDFKNDPEVGYAALGPVLEKLDKAGLKALIDPHDFVFYVKSWDAEIPVEAEARAPFFTLWKRLATICKAYPEVVVGYDLYNELKVDKENWASWDEFASEVIPMIREIDPDTPIYISGVDMSNPSGFLYAKPMEAAGENSVYSFHFYAPHAFSHQKIFRASPADPFVFYPGWIPLIDWGNKSAYGKQDLCWWDRWSLQASMLPVLEFSARHQVAMHCGEIAPIGYSSPKAADGAGLWTRDGLDTLEQYGIPWHLWNQGFGLGIEEVAAETIPRWELTR